MRAAYRLDARLGQAKVPHRPFPDQLLDCAGHVLDRHVRIDAVLVEEVDDVGLESRQRGFRDLPYVLRPAVETGLLARPRVDGKSELRGDHDLATDRSERLAD